MPGDKPSYLNFDKTAYAWQPGVNYREEPGKYRVGKGEQGVLICEPYKSEIGKYWRFKNVAVAEESSQKIFEIFLDYLQKGEFVGADMARKYLQMGFTRARRYANYKGGKKFDRENNYKPLERNTGESEKAEAATLFYKLWKMAEDNAEYKIQKADWKKLRG